MVARDAMMKAIFRSRHSAEPESGAVIAETLCFTNVADQQQDWQWLDRPC